ncbi:MAG: hypothetical protein ACTHOU_05775 [Aureliella sp.]
MSQLLLFYVRPEPGTWVYLSIFLLVGVFFVFHRVWCVRNLDILLLILLTPGLLLVYEGRKLRRQSPPMIPTSTVADVVHSQPQRLRYVVVQEEEGAADALQPRTPAGKPPASWTPDRLEFAGFAALLGACGLLMIRMLIDPALVRRPLLEPNLSIGGLSFIGVSLFLFLMSNVVTSDPELSHQRGPRLGPGYALLNRLPDLPTTPEHEGPVWNGGDEASERQWVYNVARALVILSNLAIVVAIVGVGYWHFDNVKTGIGCATMYLLFPYTAQMAGNLEHALPAALLTLAVLAYRQPLIAGCFLGLASGLVYYPLFLLPLWISFYFHRGLGRLLLGVGLMLVLLAGLLLLGGWSNFLEDIRDMFGLWRPAMKNLSGIWGLGFDPMFRLPVLVAFILLSFSFVFWPPRKTLGTLMCGTAAIMLAAQFWHGYGGGLYMAWFLPCVLLTVFRPNLDDRIAVRVVSPNWTRSDRLSVSASS